MSASHPPGVYGKIPILGDFVSRRLSTGFVHTWDAWLQRALSESRVQLGPGWLDIYLTSPIWRFVLGPGVCGESAWAGVMMPSVDKVGRYFPLTLAVGIDARFALPEIFASAAGWFETLEHLALSALEDNFNFDEFDHTLQKQALHIPMPIKEIHTTGCHPTGKNNIKAFHLSMKTLKDMNEAIIQLNACLLAEFLPVYSLWTTNGSERVTPSLLVYSDLPTAAYCDFLTGQWQRERQRVSAQAASPVFKENRQEAVDTRHRRSATSDTHLKWHSSGRSVVGNRRKINEDAFLERPEIGLWAVADGMGGHCAGDVASKAVIDALHTISVSDDLNTFTARAAECLQNINADLLTMADQAGHGRIIGTTVVVLLAAGEQCASLWVGDSRLYRYRDGVLSQLTHDHSLVSELSRQGRLSDDAPGPGISDNIITRALGAERALLIDTITHEVKTGDTYLLCSDGLVKEVQPHEIADILSHRACHESSQRLIDLALARGARDNVTVIVVRADDNREGLPFFL